MISREAVHSRSIPSSGSAARFTKRKAQQAFWPSRVAEQDHRGKSNNAAASTATKTQIFYGEHSRRTNLLLRGRRGCDQPDRHRCERQPRGQAIPAANGTRQMFATHRASGPPSAHQEPGVHLQTISETLTGFGIRPSLAKRSATACWLLITWSSTGTTR
jgi:hypothetical protein